MLLLPLLSDPDPPKAIPRQGPSTPTYTDVHLPASSRGTSEGASKVRIQPLPNFSRAPCSSFLASQQRGLANGPPQLLVVHSGDDVLRLFN